MNKLISFTQLKSCMSKIKIYVNSLVSSVADSAAGAIEELASLCQQKIESLEYNLKTGKEEFDTYKTETQTALDNKVAKISGKGLSTNDYTTAEKNKLARIADNANNYTHPSSHSAGMITQDSNHRFVTDSEKTTWNNKAGTAVATVSANGLMSSSDKSKLNGILGSCVIPVAKCTTPNTTPIKVATIENGVTIGTLKKGQKVTVYFTVGTALTSSNMLNINSTGNYYISTGDFSANITQNSYCDFEFDGSKWRLSSIYDSVGAAQDLWDSTYTGYFYGMGEITEALEALDRHTSIRSDYSVTESSSHWVSNDVLYTPRIGFYHYSKDISHTTINNGSSWVSNFIIPGCAIEESEIDEGCMNYHAAGHAYMHCFYGYNEAGTLLSQVWIAKDIDIFKGGKVNTHSGDYAEMWEWLDGNPDNEDRVGYFVSFEGNKIRKSNSQDNKAIVAVCSGSPAFLGDNALEWQGKYLRDKFGRIKYQDNYYPAEYEEVEAESGEIFHICVRDEMTLSEPMINPEYDENLKYVKREERKEWDAVGTHGKLYVRDDGTCVAGSFCMPNDNGVATISSDGFYVMERVSDNVIRIYMK